MKIINLTNFNFINQNSINKQNYISNPTISFKAENDEFRKNKSSAEKDPLEKLKNKFKQLIEENNAQKDYSSLHAEIEDIREKNNRINEITEDFTKINDILSDSKTENAGKNAQIIFDYLEAMDKLGKDRGFNRISGYDNVKREMKKHFIIDKMLASKIQDVDVPNAMLFYGPPSNGKTLFAKALAEQTLSNIVIIDAARMSEEKCIEKIEIETKKAKENYTNSSDKKTRTIILLNEAECIANSNSGAYKNFKRLLTDCSKDYKTTIFMTSNYPQFIDKSILSNEITPIKVAIEPADKKTAKKIVDNILLMTNNFPKEGTEKIVDALFSNPEGRYSNGDIVAIINLTLTENNNPKVQDFLNCIKKNEVPPSIDNELLNNFCQIKNKIEHLG